MPSPAAALLRGTVLTLCMALAACSNRADAAGALEIGDTAPDVTFRTLTGERPTLRGAQGPLLVNFWATSCVICLQEAPELVALRERLAPAGYEMISVAMPYDRPDAVLQLAQANGWTHPVAIDLDGAVLAALEPILGTPTNLLFGADGTLLERYVGRTDVAALEARINGLLTGPDSPTDRR